MFTDLYIEKIRFLIYHPLLTLNTSKYVQVFLDINLNVLKCLKIPIIQIMIDSEP